VLKCHPKKYYWRYCQGLTPIKQSSSVTLGKVVHEAFDLHYKQTPQEKIIKYIVSTFDDELATTSPEESEKIVVSKYTALGMYSHYPYKSTNQFDEVQSEKSFSVPFLRGNRYCQKMTYEGRVDGLVKKRGLWWLRELKTTSQTSRIFEQRINSSSQGTGYVWAMQKLGYPVVGIMYDYIKRPLLRKRVCEDQFDFGNRILKDYEARPELYFNQIYSYRNKQEIKLWEEDTRNVGKEIRRKIRDKTFYRNTDSCYNYNYECDYKKICFEATLDPLMLQLYFRRDGQPIK